LKDEYKVELFTSGLIDSILYRNEKEEEKYDKENKREKQDFIPVKFEVLNFNISEDSMMGIISGIKFNTNVIEINLSGNLLGKKSCFWLGTIFKNNPNIKVLDLTRCNINSQCLLMFLEGTKFSIENLNNEQLNLEKINLKDNNNITDIKDTKNPTNDNLEHPLGMLLRRFKLKWINLTNAKLGNSGVCRFLKTYLKLMGENKIFMENLILICNNFANEECLELLGQIITEKNNTLKTLVLSKNFISTPPDQLANQGPNQNTTSTASTTPNPDQKKTTPSVPVAPAPQVSPETQVKEKTDYFKNFMKSLSNSNSLEELFLISCGIGKNMDDVDIIYDMLSKNKSLVSLRLFGNEINTMEKFTKILEIFSEYKNDLKNSTLKSLDLSKNQCNIKITNDFLNLIEKLKLEYLDINQNTMEASEKEEFRKRTNELSNIKIIY
jgi:hypothetical protein